MKRSARDASRQLFSFALEQGGYFTAKQAQQAGYDYPHLDYHVSRGNFVRVGHGIYRLPEEVGQLRPKRLDQIFD